MDQAVRYLILVIGIYVACDQWNLSERSETLMGFFANHIYATALDMASEATALERANPAIAGTGLAEEVTARGYRDVSEDLEAAAASLITSTAP